MALVADLGHMSRTALDPFRLTHEYGAVHNFIAEEGSHPRETLMLGHGWIPGRDVYRIAIRCSGCDRDWEQEVTRHAMLDHVGPREIVRNILVPFLARVTKTLCFKFSLAAELAEWATLELAKAGPTGLRYSMLVHDAVRLHLCAPQDVDTMLRKLGFLHEWVPVRPILPEQVHYAMPEGHLVEDPIIRLPKEHPMAAG